jgi:Na+-transporting methylmalonyl-CoA/oxaloacetate decarboxylase gamma subunit
MVPQQIPRPPAPQKKAENQRPEEENSHKIAAFVAFTAHHQL